MLNVACLFQRRCHLQIKAFIVNFARANLEFGDNRRLTAARLHARAVHALLLFRVVHTLRIRCVRVARVAVNKIWSILWALLHGIAVRKGFDTGTNTHVTYRYVRAAGSSCLAA